MHKGFEQWSGAMQDDISDVVKYSIKAKIAIPNRIAIMVRALLSNYISNWSHIHISAHDQCGASKCVHV
jgi:hypothetical protein